MNTEKKRLPLSQVMGYGVGEVGSQFSWYMINSYLMIFYTDIVGLTAGAISVIMLIARIWDAVNDPMMGMVCDRTRTRWGKFRPYIMFAPPFLAIFNILTFTVFPVQGVKKAVICLICYIGAGMLYTIVSTAYASLVNVTADNSQHKQTLSAARNMGNALSSIILSALAMPLILFFGKSDVATAKGYFCVTLLFSLLMIPCFWITAKLCPETYVKDTGTVAQETGEKKSVLASLKALVKNDQIILVILNTLGGTIGIMGRMTLLAYYVIYVVGSYTLVAPIYTIMNVGNLIGSLLIPFATRKMGKRNYMILLNGGMVAAFVIMYLFPYNNIAFLLGVSFIIGITNSGQGVVFGMVSDSIDYGDYKNGVREEGLCCSFLTLSVKIATAICGSAGVLLLAKFGYVANAEQTDAARQGINFVVNMLPAICVAASIIPLFFYKLSNKKVEEISEALAKRNAENQ